MRVEINKTTNKSIIKMKRKSILTLFSFIMIVGVIKVYNVCEICPYIYDV